MSIRRLPREMGIWVCCDGTDETDCPEKRFTANVLAKVNRNAAAQVGWGRGLRKDRKRRDQCPYHFKLEKFLIYQSQWRRAADKARHDEIKKAMFSSEPRPKRPRPKKAVESSIPASSPSEDSARAAST